jgi:predicted RNase H-like nuclease
MTVLGIDAAWTEKEPSGVALVVKKSSRWELVNVAPSYDAFIRPIAKGVRARGSSPDISSLLLAAETLAGSSVELVAVDMPMSREPITERRASDQSVSLAYGGRWAGTHTPNPERPGKIGEAMTDRLKASGYPLLTTHIAAPGVIEVYPHPALIEIARSDVRLTYKASKVRDYWKDITPPERKLRLLDTWRMIVLLLDGEIEGVARALPLPSEAARGHEMKAFEDMLDAVVCAWVGITALEGRAVPFGDATSAIWIPLPISE